MPVPFAWYGHFPVFTEFTERNFSYVERVIIELQLVYRHLHNPGGELKITLDILKQIPIVTNNMSDEATIRTVTQQFTGEVYVSVKDLCAFIADAARRCNSEAGRDTIVGINLALMTMTKSKS